MDFTDIDKVLGDIEYETRAVEMGVDFIPRTPEEVVESVFGGADEDEARKDPWIRRFLDDPLVWTDENEIPESFSESFDYDDETLIEQAGIRYRERESRVDDPFRGRSSSPSRTASDRLEHYRRTFDGIRLRYVKARAARVLVTTALNGRGMIEFAGLWEFESLIDQYVNGEIDTEEFHRSVHETVAGLPGNPDNPATARRVIDSLVVDEVQALSAGDVSDSDR